MSTTGLPFLYQTRTILRLRSVRVPAMTRFIHATGRAATRDKNNHIPFDVDLPGGKPLKRAEGADEAEAVRGTITPTERQTFDRIFADIAARGLKARGPVIRSDSPSDSIVRIVESAAVAHFAAAGQQSSTEGLATEFSPEGLATDDRGQALSRFPPSLRAAASRALDAMDPAKIAFQAWDTTRSKELDALETLQDGEDEGLRSPAFLAELEAKRGPVQKRIEELIVKARTDHELWDVMEREVFTFPRRLGIQRQLLPPPPLKSKSGKSASRKARTKKEKAKAMSDLSNNEVESVATKEPGLAGNEEEGYLDLSVFGPLYPSFLLLGLRRLNTAYLESSPLALCVLPRIKDLGLESFVLGVSTPFYNELLSIYYHQCGDLGKMFKLLAEMRQVGLSFDEDTASVLSKVHEETRRLAKGRYGGFAELVMTMPDYERSMRDRLEYWHESVNFALNQQESAVSFAEQDTVA